LETIRKLCTTLKSSGVARTQKMPFVWSSIVLQKYWLVIHVKF